MLLLLFFFYFSVCRIHVTLDNFTIWCTAIVSAPNIFRLIMVLYWVSRDVVTVFSMSSIINIYIYLELFVFFCPQNDVFTSIPLQFLHRLMKLNNKLLILMVSIRNMTRQTTELTFQGVFESPSGHLREDKNFVLLLKMVIRCLKHMLKC